MYCFSFLSRATVSINKDTEKIPKEHFARLSRTAPLRSKFKTCKISGPNSKFRKVELSKRMRKNGERITEHLEEVMEPVDINRVGFYFYNGEINIDRKTI